jgi:hypothetical protein
VDSGAHLFFQNVLRMISTACHKVFCHLRTDDESW